MGEKLKKISEKCPEWFKKALEILGVSLMCSLTAACGDGEENKAPSEPLPPPLAPLSTAIFEKTARDGRFSLTPQTPVANSSSELPRTEYPFVTSSPTATVTATATSIPANH